MDGRKMRLLVGKRGGGWRERENEDGGKERRRRAVFRLIE